MAREPPVEPHRPPDQHPSERHDNGNNPQLSTLHYTSHSSSKSQDTDAVNTAFSKKELEGTRKFNFHDASGLNLGKVKGNKQKTKKQTPPKTAWRPISTQDKTTKSSMQQAPSTTGILSNISTHNNYTNLLMQEQANKGISGDNTNKGKSAQEVQTIEGSRDDSPKESNHNTTIVIKDHVTDNCYNKTSGIDLSLPLPHSPNIIYVDAENSDEVCGGMDGGCQEKPTKLQERVTKGGSLTHVLHEVVHTDHRIDLRASATPISVQNSQNVQENVNKNHKGQIADTGQVQNEPVDPTDQGTEVQNRGTKQIQNTTNPPGKGTTGNLQDQNEAQRKTPNNKSQGKISKKKRNAIKRRQEAEAARQGIKEGTTHKSHPQGQTHKSADNDEYNDVPSEDEFEQDTQSLGEIIMRKMRLAFT
uniref:Bifunctional endo-1,4-beta-xylanase xylA n=1 Tax=Solanum tuberosum TaxID=4113 RepID=M1DW50_SOLTU